MQEPSVIASREGNVAVLRLNEPKSYNALSPGIAAGMAEHVPALLNDPEIRCLVITGEGKAFCAGGDITAMQPGHALNARAHMREIQSWGRLLLERETPVISAVNGVAAGGGLSLMLCADMVIASDAAFFVAGFPGLGAAPDVGLGYTLPRAVGYLRAKELLFTNRRIAPEEAERIGLVNRVVPAARLMPEVMAVAHQLSAGPWSLGVTKTLMRHAFDEPLDRYLEAEADAQALAFASDDFAEGVAAFLGKRQANFKGR